MPQLDWNQRYADGDVPWDTNEPDPHLVELVDAGVLQPGRVLEIGSGTGTNALWLAARGFDVHGIDVSPLAVEQARTKAGATEAKVRFSVLDLFTGELEGAYDLVLDRGVLHIFDEPEVQARFARRVAELLHPQGQWLSLLGSTEGPDRDHGPPRRSVRDIANAIEPVLELVWLRATYFDANLPTRVKAWLVLSRPRSVPAQPSTGDDADRPQGLAARASSADT